MLGFSSPRKSVILPRLNQFLVTCMRPKIRLVATIAVQAIDDRKEKNNMRGARNKISSKAGTPTKNNQITIMKPTGLSCFLYHSFLLSPYLVLRQKSRIWANNIGTTITTINTKTEKPSWVSLVTLATSTRVKCALVGQGLLS